MNLPQVTLQSPMRFKLEEAKGNFFDRQKIIDAVGAAKARVASKQGAFVMRAARRLIRPPPKKVTKKLQANDPGAVSHAPAGSPPYSQTGLLRKFILYAWDSTSGTMLIGPILLSGDMMGEAPSTLEYGGPVNVPVRKRTSRGYRTVWVDTNLKPRPYMGPALQASRPRLAEIWKDTIAR